MSLRPSGVEPPVGSREALSRLEALRSAQGVELLGLLADEPADPAAMLRLGERLRARYPQQLVIDALAQHELRRRAAAKFTRAGEMFFTRHGLEQASAESVARYRAERYAYADVGQVVDLCCGVGGDLVALAADHDVLAVDRDPLHVRMAEANAAAHGAADRVTPVSADVRDVAVPGGAAVFVDPARRAGDTRLPMNAGEPPLAWCVDLADRVPAVGVKAAPTLPRDQTPDGWELELVAVGRELREAVLWSPALQTASRRATVLPEGHSLGPVPGDQVPVGAPGEYVVDPSPAVTRAGLVQDLARQLGAWKVDEQIAFLAADKPVMTPYGRTLQVLESLPWQEKRLRGRLRALDVGAVDFRRRGLAGDVEALRRRLRLSGSRRVTVLMTRLADRPWAVICVDAAGRRPVAG